jgi:hypothetical protein
MIRNHTVGYLEHNLQGILLVHYPQLRNLESNHQLKLKILLKCLEGLQHSNLQRKLLLILFGIKETNLQ